MKRIVGHNIGSDLAAMVRAGYTIPPVRYLCTQTAASWLYPDQDDLSLEHLVLRMTNMPQWRQTLGKLDFDDFDRMSTVELANRCGGDAEAAYRLAKIVIPQIYDEGFGKIYDLAMDVMPILAEIGGRGMAVHTSALKNKVKESGIWLKKEKAALEKILEIENLNSDVQVAKALFGRIQATPLEETTKGYSVGKRSLLWARYQAQLESKTEIVNLVTRLLEYSKQEKLHSTYYKPWLEAGGQRVHSNYNLWGTNTGRLASSRFNLQNLAPETRNFIIPSRGFDYIVSVDFAQLEWRIAAYLSRDKAMLDGIKNHWDAHAVTASRVLKIPLEYTQEAFAQFKKEHKDDRDVAKMSNFAIIYLVSDESLSWQIFEHTDGRIYLPVEDTDKPGTRSYIEAFFKLHHGYESYIDTLRFKIHSDQWIGSPTGRRWLFDKSNAGLRRASNYPIQSLSSDLVLLALRTIHRELVRGRWRSRIIGEVHDSIVFETTERELLRLISLVRGVCENIDTSEFGFTVDVPLEVESQAGRSWGTVKEL